MGERSHSFTTRADMERIYNDIQNELTMNPLGADGFWSLRTSPTYNQMTGTISCGEAKNLFKPNDRVEATLHVMISFVSGNPGTTVNVKYVWSTSEPYNLFGGGLTKPASQYMDKTNKWIEQLCRKY